MGSFSGDCKGHTIAPARALQTVIVRLAGKAHGGSSPARSERPGRFPNGNRPIRRATAESFDTMTTRSRYRITVSRRGPPARPFGWEICHSEGGAEVQRSAETFRARHEAIADAETVARSLELRFASDD
jgi:hypothetical protein